MPDQRGVSISLIELPIGVSPQVLHYETGPLSHRKFLHHGQPWLAVYQAEHDGTGWLVVKSTCRPLVLMPGDYVHIRERVEEDHGDVVNVSYEEKGSRVSRWVPRSSIVFLEEAQAPREAA